MGVNMNMKKEIHITLLCAGLLESSVLQATPCVYWKSPQDRPVRLDRFIHRHGSATAEWIVSRAYVRAVPVGNQKSPRDLARALYA